MNARIEPTVHAVTLLESFTGFGNDPSLTFRHKVAELNGRSGVGLGLFFLRALSFLLNALRGHMRCREVLKISSDYRLLPTHQ